MVQVSIYITKELDEKLTEYARKNNRSRSNFIGKLLRDYIDQQVD